MCLNNDAAAHVTALLAHEVDTLVFKRRMVLAPSQSGVTLALSPVLGPKVLC
jgi:hypothetical protein